MAVKGGIDPTDLADSGWGVIFPECVDPAIKEALRNLMAHRRQQATRKSKNCYRELSYLPGESKHHFLGRYRIGIGPVNPERIPYYLLIVGDPQAIPFDFQYDLALQYAVGRLHFDTPEEYARYAEGVIITETRQSALPREIVFFGARNPDDRLSDLLTEHVARPLAKSMSGPTGWDVRTLFGAEATSSRLARLLGGDETPRLLFASGCITADVSMTADLSGMIGIWFAPGSAGTDRSDAAATPDALVARLPQMLLGHPKGPALAVVGIVSLGEYPLPEPFQIPAYPQILESMLARMTSGQPVGWAVEYLDRLYAEISADVATFFQEFPDSERMTGLWMSSKLARNLVIFGDPAVRLSVAPSTSSPGTAREPVSRSSYFLSLAIENVRCFGPRQTLNFSNAEGRPARWTVILGDNGLGKTTLLQCVAAVAPSLRFTRCNLGVEKALPSWLLDWNVQRHGTPAQPRLEGLLESGSTLGDNGRPSKERFSTTLLHGAILKTRDEALDELPDIFCCGYGAARQMGEANLFEKTMTEPSTSLFSDAGPLLNAEEWLLRADYAASKARAASRWQAELRRDRIEEILKRILPDVKSIRYTESSSQGNDPGVRFETSFGWVSAGELSLGYRTIMAWIVDLASRMFTQYPDSPDPLAQPVVVLVDEIDLHLHPTWQRSLMGYLSERFTNAQFIVTAHSPLVAQTATEANLVVLRREGDHVVIDNEVEAVHGWRIDQVLTSDLFGLASARPPKFENLLIQRRKLLAKDRLLHEERARLAEIETALGPLPAGESLEDWAAMDVIHRAAKRLKEQE